MTPDERMGRMDERIKRLEKDAEKKGKIWLAVVVMVLATVWHAVAGALHIGK